MKTKIKKEIPIFFATDNNYAPFLAVTLKSLLDNASKKYFYKIYVLTSSIHQDLKDKINKTLTENSSIEYVCVTEQLAKIKSKLHLRDYYSMETYYRFFIADMFPQFKKVIYLDCDIILKGDISKFYNTHISNYLVAAVQDRVFAKFEVFSNYAEQVLDLKTKKVFNAGVLLMNAEMFRAYNILERFVKLLSKYKFRVTQDEDYLNVLCKDKVKYLDLGWNKMPFEDDDDFDDKKLNLVHYNLSLKPWHYDNIKYQELFWHYAKQTDFYEDIALQLKYYSDEKKQKDDQAFERLKAIAFADAHDPDNFKRLCAREKRGHYLKNTLRLFIRIPGIKSLSRIIGTRGYKIAYGYRNR